MTPEQKKGLLLKRAQRNGGGGCRLPKQKRKRDGKNVQFSKATIKAITSASIAAFKKSGIIDEQDDEEKESSESEPEEEQEEKQTKKKKGGNRNNKGLKRRSL